MWLLWLIISVELLGLVVLSGWMYHIYLELKKLEPDTKIGIVGDIEYGFPEEGGPQVCLVPIYSEDERVYYFGLWVGDVPLLRGDLVEFRLGEPAIEISGRTYCYLNYQLMHRPEVNSPYLLENKQV